MCGYFFSGWNYFKQNQRDLYRRSVTIAHPEENAHGFQRLSIISPFMLENRNRTRYTFIVIRSFRHKGLAAFFASGSKAGINPSHASRLSRQLARLDRANGPFDMDVPGWSLHSLAGSLAGHSAVAVSGNWRLTFAFKDGDAVLVDYQDYH
jgi:toxin HigB-1